MLPRHRRRARGQPARRAARVPAREGAARRDPRVRPRAGGGGGAQARRRHVPRARRLQRRPPRRARLRRGRAPRRRGAQRGHAAAVRRVRERLPRARARRAAALARHRAAGRPHPRAGVRAPPLPGARTPRGRRAVVAARHRTAARRRGGSARRPAARRARRRPPPEPARAAADAPARAARAPPAPAALGVVGSHRSVVVRDDPEQAVPVPHARARLRCRDDHAGQRPHRQVPALGADRARQPRARRGEGRAARDRHVPLAVAGTAALAAALLGPGRGLVAWAADRVSSARSRWAARSPAPR